ncbi:MAG: D-glycero-beta-D-manno-heptose 1-phosphate adenylyltransferase [Candidatus Nanopelagicales bacterium]|jgi:rfaE bifunctional protein nucleotidyltransferase chain/domain/rfaE bifunctional protein kinase chain/domain|nr:D-glycero-beta-D-manno-heptose 1-phosphate adenylyltransferase [Candidatus Nanopelagicales bacterium]
MTHPDRAPLVVIGDALLDVDVTGSATRLCPDDPGPVLDDLVEVARPGGAGLAALLATRAGRPVVLVTALGEDEEGERLRAALAPHVTLMDLRHDGPTVVKTRVRSGGRTLLRLDRGSAETRLALDPAARAALRDLLGRCAAVLASDYGLGVLGQPHVRRELVRAAGEVPVVWDPHPRGSAPVPGAAMATPNAAEAARLSGHGERVGDLAAVIGQARGLADRWRVASVAVTRGASGAVLAGVEGNPLVVVPPAPADGDTCGAGDAFAATATAALATGESLEDAVRAAVLQASGFVAAGGAARVVTAASPGDAEPVAVPAPTGGTPIGPEAAEALVARVRAGGGTVVVAGGCFDLLHAGHVEYLQSARGLGDCLVVALNSDRSVRALKGPERPLVGQDDRARVLAALGCVDAVVVFDEDTPAALLARLRPEVFAKGGDYRLAPIPEAEVVAAHGGQVVVLPTLHGRSSTRLVQAAQAAAHPTPAARPPATPTTAPAIRSTKEERCPTPLPASGQ